MDGMGHFTHSFGGFRWTPRPLVRDLCEALKHLHATGLQMPRVVVVKSRSDGAGLWVMQRSIHLFICLLYLFIYLFLSFFLYLFIYLFIYIYIFIY